MEKSIRAYRKKTGKPLITSCFRIIPVRILKDDDENLVRSITDRTMKLLDIAEACFPVIKSKLPPRQKLAKLSSLVTQGDGCGETWAKMLTVCMDLAYPQDRMLDHECDVGTGAVKPLQCLLPKGGPPDKKIGIGRVVKEIEHVENSSHESILEYGESC